jgi:DNA-binding transcriptional LysR family regulator
MHAATMRPRGPRDNRWIGHLIAAKVASMDLNQLALFARVAAAGSFSDAARALAIDRAQVSRGIAALERDLGVRLFVRTTRSVRPTAEGEALARQITGPLGELERAASAVPAAHAIPAGVVTVTAPLEIGRALIAPLLPRFRARYPAVRLVLELTDQVVAVSRGVDLALRVGRGGAGSQVVRRLRSLSAGLFASPAYLARRGPVASAAALADHEVMWPMVRGVRAFAPAARPRPPSIACGDFGTLAELAEAGAGIALLPTFVAERAVARGALVRVAPEVTLASAPLYLISARVGELPSRVRALRDLLIAELAG